MSDGKKVIFPKMQICSLHDSDVMVKLWKEI